VVGLADYDVRHWHGWYRHITLVLLAHTWLKLIQHHEREKKRCARLVDFQPGRTPVFAEYHLAAIHSVT
jgi:SRSO17 transposase